MQQLERRHPAVEVAAFAAAEAPTGLSTQQTLLPRVDREKLPLIDGEDCMGANEVLELLTRILPRGAYPDLMFTQTGAPMYDLQHPVVGFPWVGTGTFSGRMDPPGIEGTGRPFTFSGVEVFTFRGDRTSKLNASYDLLRLLRQSGLLEGSWA